MTASHHLHFCMYGRSSVWRSYLPNLRHHHHGKCRRRVQACASRILPVALCPHGSHGILHHLPGSRFHPTVGHIRQCCRIMDLRHQFIGRIPLCIEKEALIPYHHTSLQQAGSIPHNRFDKSSPYGFIPAKR